MENTNIIVTDTLSLDAAILDIFQTHYGLINANCKSDMMMPTYASWLCDSAAQLSTSCSNTKRMCADTCTLFGNEYRNVTNTCRGDYKSEQLQISVQINDYCPGLNATNCILPAEDLQGNCGMHSKDEICTSCPSKLDSFCTINALQTSSYKIISMVLIILGCIIAVGLVMCCICCRVKKRKKIIARLKERDENMDGDHYFYDSESNQVYPPKGINIEGSVLSSPTRSLAAPSTTTTSIINKNSSTLPVTQLNRRIQSLESPEPLLPVAVSATFSGLIVETDNPPRDSMKSEYSTQLEKEINEQKEEMVNPVHPVRNDMDFEQQKEPPRNSIMSEYSNYSVQQEAESDAESQDSDDQPIGLKSIHSE